MFILKDIFITIYKYLYILSCDFSFDLLYTLSLSSTEITDVSN